MVRALFPKELIKHNNDMPKIVEHVVNANDVSRIAECVIINGDISSTSDIRVDGKVNGKVYSENRVVVGETALLSGSLVCSDVDFWGKMEGDIYVKNLLTLKCSAEVNGKLNVRKIQVELGAQINGSCQMITEQEFDKLRDGVVTVSVPEAGAKPVRKQEEDLAAAEKTKA